jgi:transcriptional regulator GlxA family with amidase domain
MCEKTAYRFFKENLGESPYETLNTIRVEKAKIMLKNTKTSIIVISEQCGFGTENTFYRNFKKILGITPNNYRNNVITVKHNPRIQGYLSFNKSNAIALLKSYI